MERKGALLSKKEKKILCVLCNSSLMNLCELQNSVRMKKNFADFAFEL